MSNHHRNQVNEFEESTSTMELESLNNEIEEEPSPTTIVTNEHAGIRDCFVVQDHVSVHIENMLSNMPPTSRERSIFRVHHQLREVNEKAYEPVILAIGPYHHGNGKFKFMEQKLRYLQRVLQRCREGTIDRYVLALRELEEQARKCYAETIELSQKKFLAVMLIDGCFIIEWLRKWNLEKSRDGILKQERSRDGILKEERSREAVHSPSRPRSRIHYLNDPLRESDWLRYYLRRDLLLLENQLPLFVLSKLYDLTIDSEDLEDSKKPDEFNVLAIKYLKREEGDPDQNWTCGNREHLLHLYYGWRTHGLPGLAEKPQLLCKRRMPSAIELTESGVRFRAVKKGHLSDIKFENGTLEIPVLMVEDDTESEFQNLIAYEQHGQSRFINYFTDYVTFMDCLINSSKDVKVLRRAGIIRNYLGDDEVVAQMFNKMCDNVISSCFYYSEILENLNKHSNERMNVWIAKLRREYFHSPWAFLSVVAAIVLLLLTAAQTVFTILS